MAAIMFLYYVVPYQRALTPAGRDFSFDWFSGEALFAYIWAVVFVLAAWLMYRNVHREYLPKDERKRGQTQNVNI